MKVIVLTILTATLLGCGQKSPEYSIVKSADTTTVNTPMNINVVDKTFDIAIKKYSKGDYIIADTVDKQITLYKPLFIDIAINKGPTVTIDKSILESFYPNKKDFYHFVLGKTSIGKINVLDNKIIFKTEFGLRGSASGQTVVYSIGEDGSFEFMEFEEVQAEK